MRYLSKLKISSESFGNVMYLVNRMKYMDFENKDIQLGWKYEVLVPSIGMEKSIVKIEGLENKIDDDILDRVKAGEMIEVLFKNLQSKLYYNTNNYLMLTAGADSIMLKKKEKNKDIANAKSN